MKRETSTLSLGERMIVKLVKRQLAHELGRPLTYADHARLTSELANRFNITYVECDDEAGSDFRRAAVRRGISHRFRDMEAARGDDIFR